MCCSFGLRHGRSSNYPSPQTLCGSWGLLLGLGTHCPLLPTHPLSAIVPTGIESSWTLEALLEELWATNAHRLSDFDLERGIRQAVQLNRRNPAATMGAPDAPT